jgi:putative two-component system response regulator
MAGLPRILLVDDLPENLDVLANLLEAEGYATESASDGQEAVDKALAAPPDLILMDVSMPRLNGFDACRRLKADARTKLVPLVLVTGLTAREDRIEGIAAGCDDFLTKPVDAEQLLARTRNLLRTKALVDELEQAENVLVSLARALDAKDSHTRGHSRRVAELAERLGTVAGLGREECRNLKRAGQLHDIGKIGTPIAYIQKPGKLTDEEWATVKQHPAVGAEICSPLRTMAPLVALIRGHHERLDGGGYPDGLRAQQIPTALRCLSIADVYDALTSDRPYRAALSEKDALRILRDEARQGLWDSDLIEVFASTLLTQA